MTSDDEDRIALCLKVLAEQNEQAVEVFKRDCRQSLSLMLEAQESSQMEIKEAKSGKAKTKAIQGIILIINRFIGHNYIAFFHHCSRFSDQVLAVESR